MPLLICIVHLLSCAIKVICDMGFINFFGNLIFLGEMTNPHHPKFQLFNNLLCLFRQIIYVFYDRVCFIRIFFWSNLW